MSIKKVNLAINSSDFVDVDKREHLESVKQENKIHYWLIISDRKKFSYLTIFSIARTIKLLFSGRP